jgi:archaemetzincin
MPIDPGPHRVEAVSFLPVGSIDPERVGRLASLTSRRLAVPCRVSPRPVDDEGLEIPRRGQLNADELLHRVEDLFVKPGVLKLAVTERDAAIPIFTFVFGRARRGGDTAVVSLARLDPVYYGLPADPSLAAQRAVHEILHELGHVVGLGHCGDFGCLMHFSPTVEDADVRGGQFCPVCTKEIPVGFLAHHT